MTNEDFTLAGIPLRAYEYVVNGKPVLEWTMDGYTRPVEKASGSRNDPNDWDRERGDLRWIW